jgi:hypothetical protein
LIPVYGLPGNLASLACHAKFIDLPDEEERREIFAIRLTRRKQDAAAFDLATLGGFLRDFVASG